MMPERGNPFDRAMVLCAFIEDGGAAIAVCAHTLLVEAVRDDLEEYGSSDEKRQALLLELRQFIDSRGGWKFSGGTWTRLPEGGV